MINALSLEEDDLEDDRDTVASPISHSLTAEAFAPRPLALDEPEIDSGSSSEDDDEVEAAEQAPLAHSQLEEDTFHLAPDTSPVTPMTPLPASPVAPGVNRDLNSSIHAIYRPIAARRRTVTGEEGECVSGGKYMAQPSFGSRSILGSIDSTSQSVSDIAFLREGGNGLGSSTRKRGDTVSSVGRQAKLADKLEDIFGLTEREEVIAGQCRVPHRRSELTQLQNTSAGCSARYCCRASCTSRRGISASTHTCHARRCASPSLIPPLTLPGRDHPVRFAFGAGCAHAAVPQALVHPQGLVAELVPELDGSCCSFSRSRLTRIVRIPTSPTATSICTSLALESAD